MESLPRDLAGAALASLGNLVVVLDHQGGIVLFNREAEKVTGSAAAEVTGRPFWELFMEPEDARPFRALFDHLAPELFPWTCESLLWNRGGEPRLVSWIFTCLQEEGRITHVTGAGTDVTERRWAEEDLLRSHQTLRTLIDASPLAINVLDRLGTVRVWNPAAEGIFGWTRREVLGRNLPTIPEERREEFESNLRRTFVGDSLDGVETVRRRKDGSPVDVQIWTALLRSPQDEPESILTMTADISVRKRAEEALREREEQLRLITDSVPALIAYIDAERRYRFVNLQYETWFGHPRSEVYGKTMAEILGEEAYETLRSNVDAALSGQPVTYEAWVPYATGTRFVHATYVPHRDKAGEIRGFFVLVSDITDRKRVEEALQSSQEALRTAKEAVEAASRAKDHFLAILSHELRTPLTPVLAAVSALEEDSSIQGHLRETLAMIRRNVELEARLIDDLLDLTRVSSGKLELHRQGVDAQHILVHAVNICCAQEVAAGRLRLEMGITPGDYRSWADGPRLTQVFWNLLNNAVKFTPTGGVVRVRSRVDTGSAGRSIVVDVEDNGIGIEPEMLPRVFDAFEQADRRITRRYGGLGLGLAVSKAILELHGGSLTATSAGRGRGATFTVRFPTGHLSDLDDTDVIPGNELARARESPLRADLPLRILLVEDHADTAEAMADLLDGLGYEVTVAGSVAQGLAAAEAAGGSEGFDLLLSDLGLPDGSGHDLMRELVRRYGLRGIALSGYGMEEDIRKSQEAGFEKHLTKPVTLQALRSALQQVAAEGSPTRDSS